LHRLLRADHYFLQSGRKLALPVPFFTPPSPKPHPRLSGRYLKEAFMVNLKNGFGLINPLLTLKSEIRFQWISTVLEIWSFKVNKKWPALGGRGFLWVICDACFEVNWLN
jgi:hypothetical protein